MAHDIPFHMLVKGQKYFIKWRGKDYGFGIFDGVFYAQVAYFLCESVVGDGEFVRLCAFIDHETKVFSEKFCQHEWELVPGFRFDSFECKHCSETRAFDPAKDAA